MSNSDRPASLRLTAACWPVFEFLSNFVRQVKHGIVPVPEQARYEALSALRDAEDLARDDPATEKLWHDKAKAMMVYLLDYLGLSKFPAIWNQRSLPTFIILITFLAEVKHMTTVTSTGYNRFVLQLHMQFTI